ncbi:hypothetical protein [Piscinibacterium candidicorallinum]|uniref:Calcineurin-like phosphoesterase domain-containing protein n=1 Tax=Piscinibacterium candidicorallinum TaxID=1793872 RepID=A0ABV7H5C2_9BURK
MRADRLHASAHAARVLRGVLGLALALTLAGCAYRYSESPAPAAAPGSTSPNTSGRTSDADEVARQARAAALAAVDAARAAALRAEQNAREAATQAAEEARRAVATRAATAPGFRFHAMGDLPYGNDAQFLKLIDTINARGGAFSIHLGDIKTGTTPCDDETFLRVRGYFDRFTQPLFYTPGDNEWTDCYRASAGVYVPTERLAKLRELFFATGTTRGTPRRVDSQGALAAGTARARFVENQRWVEQGVLFMSLHVVGSGNGIADAAEYSERNAANLAWLAEGFAAARSSNAPAVVIAMQAYLSFQPGARGMADTIDAIAREAAAFGKPVLVLQGDGHRLLIDRPWLDRHPAKLANITRVMVPGDQQVAAVEVTVDLREGASPFAFRVVSAINLAESDGK